MVKRDSFDFISDEEVNCVVRFLLQNSIQTLDEEKTVNITYTNSLFKYLGKYFTIYSSFLLYFMFSYVVGVLILKLIIDRYCDCGCFYVIFFALKDKNL